MDLYAAVPDAKGTPQPYTLTNLKVSALIGDSSVLLAVPPAVAPTLQAALLVKDTKFTYRLLPGTPTPTIAPTPGNTPTATPSATPSPVPEAGQSYLRLSTADKLDLAASWLATGSAQLVIVEKLDLPPSIARLVPVTILAASLHRYSTASAISSGEIIRCHARAPGLAAMTLWRKASGSSAASMSSFIIRVSPTGPGQTAFTRIRSPAWHRARLFVRPIRACLLME